MMTIDDVSDEQTEKFKENFPKLFATIVAKDDWFGNQLKIAALYIMSYELFKDYAEGQFKFFFSDGWQKNKHDEIVELLGEQYKQAYQKYSNGKKCSLFDRACNWFHEMEALDDADMEAISTLTKLRNELTHQLFKILAGEEYPELDKCIIRGPINQYHKLSNWWIRNFEAALMPENFEHLDEQEISSATAMHVQMLVMLSEKI